MNFSVRLFSATALLCHKFAVKSQPGSKGLEIDTCPFANLPERKRTQWALTKEEMKNCVWLKPELVAQIEFTEWTPDGHLRHSKFIGMREDKAARGRSCGRSRVRYDSETLPGLAVGQ